MHNQPAAVLADLQEVVQEAGNLLVCDGDDTSDLIGYLAESCVSTLCSGIVNIFFISTTTAGAIVHHGKTRLLVL
jgi:hypothetical protein